VQLICGVFHLDASPALSAELESMLAALQPSCSAAQHAAWIDGPVALARLAVREPEGVACLPVGSGGMVLTADCRLDEPDPVRSDEQRLLCALEANDAKTLGALLGDFAAAGWEAQCQRLTCARDALGVRPLFYVHVPGRVFAFASRPAALLAAGVASPQLDHAYIARTLLYRASGPECSLFKEIRRVPPGSSLLVTPRQFEIRNHWRLPDNVSRNERITPHEAAEELRHLLTQAVRCRLPRQGKIATHLSGGLDSSALTLLAAQAVDTARMHAYSMLPNQLDHADPATEWPFVLAVLERAPAMAWTPMFAEEGMSFVRPRMQRDHLFPVAGSPDALILQHASAQGAGCVLSGWGGDEGVSFNGRGVLAEALLRRRWRYVLDQARKLAARRGCPCWRVLAAEIVPHLPAADWVYRQSTGAAYFGASASFIKPELRAAAGATVRRQLARGRRLRYALLSGNHLWQQAELLSLAAAAQGMVMLFPLLDRRVIEFANTLPGEVFLRDGMRRWLFRQAMTGTLPPLLLERTTKHRPIHDADRIVRACAADSRAWIAGLAGTARVTSVLDVAAIERCLARLTEGAKTAADSAATGLMQALRVAAYLEQHA
jgi:asparagine synthase (glutamine-hydrolysing)